LQPLENYYKNKSIACGLHASCRTCCQEKQRIIHQKERDKIKNNNDEIDYKRIIKYLKSSRIPTSERTKPELINLWNQHTPWYIPRISNNGQTLAIMELIE